jgi:hypothetical protein
MGIRWKESEVDDYLREYPKQQKWVVRCSGCHRQGHLSDTPQDLSQLRKFLRPMGLSARGLCQDCESAA